MSTLVDADERLARIERLAPHPGLPVMSELVAEIAREAASYVAALDRFSADGRAEDGLRLAVRLAPYWNAHGLFGEGRACLLALLEAAAEISPTLRAQALERIGTLAFEQGANEEARSQFGESLAAARDAADQIAEAAAYAGLARCALMAGELDVSRRDARACEQIHRGRGDEHALDPPLHIVAYADYIAGDDERARAGFEETLELNRRLGTGAPSRANSRTWAASRRAPATSSGRSSSATRRCGSPWRSRTRSSSRTA
jgi:tetratricopeptide (TPR) repeat protein